MQELVLGYDHGFGRGRSGDVELVRRLAHEDGFVMDVVPAVKDDGQPISSSLIRTAVAHGDLEFAERGLGRAYSVRGRVERGAGRGRTIGVPTINLASPDPRKLMPRIESAKSVTGAGATFQVGGKATLSGAGGLRADVGKAGKLNFDAS